MKVYPRRSEPSENRGTYSSKSEATQIDSATIDQDIFPASCGKGPASQFSLSTCVA